MIQRMGLFVLCGCLGTGLIGGCSKDDELPEHKSVKGRVAEINKETGEVGMLWYSEKKGEEIRLEGKLAQGAEILINGRTASLDDVLIDDEVEVIGSVVGEGESRRLIAKKVTVTRVEDLDDDPTKGGDQEQERATEPAEQEGRAVGAS